MSLTSRLDGFEGRFLFRWTCAWIAVLVFGCVVLELFALQRTRIDPDLEASPVDELLDIGVLEPIALVGVLLFGPILAWMALGGTYPRPSLAAWIGWMTLGVLATAFAMGIALILLVPFDESDSAASTPIEAGPIAYLLGYIVDLISKLGYVFAFLTVAWRTALSLTIAFAAVTLVLAVFGISIIMNDLIETLETLEDVETWGLGVDWAEAPLWAIEAVLLGAGSGFAIIYGNRWQTRDVDDRVFE